MAANQEMPVPKIKVRRLFFIIIGWNSCEKLVHLGARKARHFLSTHYCDELYSKSEHSSTNLLWAPERNFLAFLEKTDNLFGIIVTITLPIEIWIGFSFYNFIYVETIVLLIFNFLYSTTGIRPRHMSSSRSG